VLIHGFVPIVRLVRASVAVNTLCGARQGAIIDVVTRILVEVFIKE
jgi:hypothetical protein